ncbi:MAG: hypothetical protein ACR2QM_04605 [Longimicrobiales bacterium]
MSGDTVLDALAAGVSHTLDLRSNGTTRGSLFLPAELNEPDVVDGALDLTGTWILTVSTLTLEHDADTFLRDVDFAFDRVSILRGQLSDVSSIVLEKR